MLKLSLAFLVFFHSSIALAFDSISSLHQALEKKMLLAVKSLLAISKELNNMI